MAWRSRGPGSARQLYYACDERRPRIYDQGLAGFAMGTDDPALGYLSIVRLPPQGWRCNRRFTRLAPAGRAVQRQCLRLQPALPELQSMADRNAGRRVGRSADGEDLRERAQAWLRKEGYAPEPVEVGSRFWMLASYFVPLLHLDDHPG
jgi:hypothetical protein